MNVLGDFLVFCQTGTFECLNLILQLLVLILYVGELLRIMLRASSGALTLSKSGQLGSHLSIFLQSLLVRLIKRLVLGDHTLLILKHLIQVFELLR